MQNTSIFNTMNAHEKSFTFRPYRTQMVLAILFGVIALLSFFYALQTRFPVPLKVLFALLGMFCAFCFFRMYMLTPLIVTVDHEGIKMRNSKTKEVFYALWTDFEVLYIIYNQKGEAFYLFATQKMTSQKQLQLINATFSAKQSHPRLSVDGNICIVPRGYGSDIRSLVQDKLDIVEGRCNSL